MNERERLLAATVLGFLLIIVGYSVYGSVNAALKKRRRVNSELSKKISKLDKIVLKGKQADRRIEELQRRSLPAEVAQARSLYQSWLHKLVGRVGLANPQFIAGSSRPASYDNRVVYHRLGFTVRGQGTLRQLVQLLYEFYSVDDLHQIRRLTIQPIKDSRELKLTLTIEAGSMTEAVESNVVANVPSERLAVRDENHYYDVILGRNLFAPPNNPPQLSSIGSKEVALGRSVSFTANAKDSDSLDRLTFQLGDGAPPGASIGETSGSFRWTPDKLGEQEITVQVADDGVPSKSDSETIRVAVVEPPPPTPPETKVAEPPKLRFDDAKHTYVSSINKGISGRKEVWLTKRTSGEVLKLHEGDVISVGSVQGKIRRIAEKAIEIVADEKVIVVSFGDNLAEGDELPVEGL